MFGGNQQGVFLGGVRFAFLRMQRFLTSVSIALAKVTEVRR
jgi:hypothetical protein